MTDLPDPLTPCDCDLRGMEWMPLFGTRLFSSDFVAIANDAEFRAAVHLWWACWLQVPAGSLPNDDAVLCKLAGLGRDIKEWKRLRGGNALHGFRLCNDGRFYHQLQSEQAKEAWDRRVKDRDRKSRWRDKGRGRDADGDADKSRTEPSDDGGRDDAVRADRTRHGQDRTKEEKKEREIKDSCLLSPVLERAEPAGGAVAVAVRTMLGKTVRKLETTANEPLGKKPKLTVVDQQNYALHGSLPEPPSAHLRPVEPQRTVEEQLAMLGVRQ